MAALVDSQSRASARRYRYALVSSQTRVYGCDGFPVRRARTYYRVVAFLSYPTVRRLYVGPNKLAAANILPVVLTRRDMSLCGRWAFGGRIALGPFLPASYWHRARGSSLPAFRFIGRGFVSVGEASFAGLGL